MLFRPMPSEIAFSHFVILDFVYYAQFETEYFNLGMTHFFLKMRRTGV